MNYNGIDCPVCGRKFEQADDVVVCPICGTPHHRHCWNENGRCINEEKHIEGFVWQMMNKEASPIRKNDNTAKICPVCGESNDPCEPVCTKCGERLKNNRNNNANPVFAPFGQSAGGNWQTEMNPDVFSPYQNVHAQDAKTLYGENTAIEDIPVSEMAEYIQKNSNKYIGRMLDMQEKETKLSWSWASALGSFFWCFYRKMTGLGTLLMFIWMSVSFCVSLAIPLICSYINPAMYNEYTALTTELINLLSHLSESGAASMPAEYYELMFQLASSPLMIASSIVNIASAVIISVITGFFGTYFYKKKILKDIRTIRQVSVNSVSYHMYLRQRGGVSIINLMLPVLIYSMFTMFTNYL